MQHEWTPATSCFKLATFKGLKINPQHGTDVLSWAATWLTRSDANWQAAKKNTVKEHTLDQKNKRTEEQEPPWTILQLPTMHISTRLFPWNGSPHHPWNMQLRQAYVQYRNKPSQQTTFGGISSRWRLATNTGYVAQRKKQSTILYLDASPSHRRSI